METKTSKIFFYEWSNLKNQPLGFETTRDFLNFCDKSNIKVSGNNRFYLLKNYTTYAVCRKGHPELVLSGNIKNLRKNYSKHNCKNK